MNKKIILSGLVIFLLLAGCLGKKECEDTMCIYDAVNNNCEEAIYEDRLGVMDVEVFRKGDTCEVVTTLYSFGEKSSVTTCTRSFPIVEGEEFDCKMEYVWCKRGIHTHKSILMFPRNNQLWTKHS